MLLFVYGTLKRGFRNNFYLEDQDFVEEVDTRPLYRLFDNGYFPMMVEDLDHGYSVSGEIWEVDDDFIEIIDDHEMLYERKLIEIDGYDEVYAYIYVYGDLHSYQECYGTWG
jgi:gamma-glutamylcyclotransferase (GGCT)/AIG2-like uncharacterized protein YtfP